MLPIHKAAGYRGHLDIIAALVGAGVHADARDEYGMNFLHHAAAENGMIEAVAAAVVLYNIPVDARSRYGESALALAVDPAPSWFSASDPACFTDFAAELLRVGGAVDVATSRQRGREQPIHVAARKGAAECVVLLLEHGADPNAASDHGTPRQIAKKEKKHAVANILHKHFLALKESRDSRSVYHRNCAQPT